MDELSTGTPPTEEVEEKTSRVYAHVLWAEDRQRYEIHKQTGPGGTDATDEVLEADAGDTLVVTLSQRKSALCDVRIQAGAFDVEPTRGRNQPGRYRFRLSQFAPTEEAERGRFSFQPWVLDGRGDWHVVHGPPPRKGDEAQVMSWQGRPPGSIIFPPGGSQ